MSKHSRGLSRGIACLALGVALGGCAEGNTEGEGQTTTTVGTTSSSIEDIRDNFDNFNPTHSSLRELVQGSDRILLGEVVAKSPGYLIGEAPGELAYDSIVIRVAEVLRGSGISAGDNQVIFELHRESDVETDYPAVSPAVGARGAFFLKEMPAPPARRPPAASSTQWFFAGTQGGFFELPNDGVAPRDQADELSKSESAKGWRRLLQDIRAEARR